MANDQADRTILRDSIDQIPLGLRTKLLAVLEETEETQQSFSVFMEFSAKDAERHVQEVMFLEGQIKTLLQTIRATKDADSITALRVTAKETIERIQERKRQEELKRLTAKPASI